MTASVPNRAASAQHSRASAKSPWSIMTLKACATLMSWMRPAKISVVPFVAETRGRGPAALITVLVWLRQCTPSLSREPW